MSNARIQFSAASEEKWLQVNPVLREGELVIARKANGKRKLVVGKPGGSSYANSEVVWDAEQAETYMNTTKDLSENVNVFVPHIDSSGILTWTNKAGLDNPSPITIKGIKGDPGEKGEQGQRGEQGAQGIQGPRGIQGEQGERGVQGAQGPAGNAATITIGNVTTSAPGTAASVTNRGTPSAAVLDFVLPKGKDGADGGVTVDDTLSDTSTNPVQNKVVKAALDNRAVLDESNTFTSPNHFDDIYMADGLNSLKWYNGSPNFVVASINSKKYTGEAATAKKTTQDGDGNVITSTYATKTELSSCVKSVNNVTPDENGNVSISISGGGGGGSNITVDTELSATSTNPVQNKVIYNALLNKVGTDIFTGFTLMGATAPITWRQGSQVVGSLTASNYTGTALRATQDGDGNTITETYTKKADFDKTISQLGVAFQEKVDRSDLADVATSGKYTDLLNRPDYVVQSVNNVRPDTAGNVTIDVSGSNVTVDTTLSATSTNAIANKAVYDALNKKLDKTGTAEYANKDSAGNVITDTYAKKSEVSGVVKSVNGTKPDASGNVTIAVSSGGGVSTSESNTWTAQQNFHDLMLSREKYTTYVVNGTSDTPITSTMAYAVTGAFTLSLATLAGALSASQSSVFTAYFSANGDYPLTITNAGTLKYIGSASDVAITSAGMLLNILMTKDASGNLTSIVQASKLS